MPSRFFAATWTPEIRWAKIAIDFDVFNALNSDTVLGKQYDARMTGVLPFGQVLEIMNPRIARLGVRLVF